MTDRVMLLIDADNVSVDVIEQAVKLVIQQHGGLHVRRAYCTAEGAVKHQAVFRRLSIKPMVNLSTGKNSTDIALAVDAIDLVLAERPDVVVIASSDSDFAPLVQRLREKGCEVRGIGQQGKTGDDTQDVYDDFTVLEHRKPPSARAAAGDEAPAKTARSRAPAASKSASKAVTKTAAAKKAPAKKVAAKVAAPARKPRGGRAAAADTAAAEPPQPAPAAAEVAAPARRTHASAARSAASSQALLDCLPELSAGQSLALNVAVQRLREAQLLGKNNSSLKLFAQFGDQFELLPPDKPSQVRLRR